jgi:excisionase family DNA binding protein
MAWLTVQEAAELLRVPVSWLYERTRTNSIPHVKLGKYLRFDRDELTTWIDEMRRDGRGLGATNRFRRPIARTEQRVVSK